MYFVFVIISRLITMKILNVLQILILTLTRYKIILKNGDSFYTILRYLKLSTSIVYLQFM